MNNRNGISTVIGERNLRCYRRKRQRGPDSEKHGKNGRNKEIRAERKFHTSGAKKRLKMFK